MPAYRITPEAKEDLRDIARYTLDTWGDSQHERYRNQLAKCFHRIASGEIVTRHFSDTYPDLCVVRCEHHYVFYLEAKSVGPVSILAVLHENMDCLARLKNRLE